ncbi:MAG: hypothetical protein M1829_006375 [Trizodia sp. TS-e1964]|nr:MAG: hypothetical protein M1829_006375 [Trizodia sp. TS-e1964]
MALFTDIFLYTIVVPVLPFALPDRTGIPLEDDSVQQWSSVLLAIYGAGTLVGSPIVGYSADHSSSRRLPLLIGLLALTGSTVMLCFGRTIAAMAAARVLQGVSASIVWVVGLALVVDTVGQKNVGRAMGYLTIAVSVGTLIGPLLAGPVYAKGGYYSVFAMAFGTLGLDIFLRLFMIEKKVAAKWVQGPNSAGYGTFANSGTVVQPSKSTGNSSQVRRISQEPLPNNENTVQAVERSPSGGILQSQDPATPAILTRSNPPSEPARANGGIKKRFVDHLPPTITLLGSRRMLAALWGSFVFAFIVTAFDATIPLFVQAIFYWDSVGAGLIFIAELVPFLVGPLIGIGVDRYGPRWFSGPGLLASVAPIVLLRLVTHNSIEQKVLFGALLFVLGLTLTFVISPLLAEVVNVVENKESKIPGLFGPSGAYAQAYGLMNFAFSAGTLVGPIWAGFILASDGWGTMTWTIALFGGLSSFPLVSCCLLSFAV